MSQPLTLKRANTSRPSGQWQHEDYDVLADGRVVGRIYEDDPLALPDLHWFWSVMGTPATPVNGTAATREQAMAKFRWAWEKAKAGVSAWALSPSAQPEAAFGPSLHKA
jgi:hypothetical protein